MIRAHLCIYHLIRGLVRIEEIQLNIFIFLFLNN